MGEITEEEASVQPQVEETAPINLDDLAADDISDLLMDDALAEPSAVAQPIDAGLEETELAEAQLDDMLIEAELEESGSGELTVSDAAVEVDMLSETSPEELPEDEIGHVLDELLEVEDVMTEQPLEKLPEEVLQEAVTTEFALEPEATFASETPAEMTETLAAESATEAMAVDADSAEAIGVPVETALDAELDMVLEAELASVTPPVSALNVVEQGPAAASAKETADSPIAKAAPAPEALPSINEAALQPLLERITALEAALEAQQPKELDFIEDVVRRKFVELEAEREAFGPNDTEVHNIESLVNKCLDKTSAEDCPQMQRLIDEAIGNAVEAKVAPVLEKLEAHKDSSFTHKDWNTLSGQLKEDIRAGLLQSEELKILIKRAADEAAAKIIREDLLPVLKGQ